MKILITESEIICSPVRVNRKYRIVYKNDMQNTEINGTASALMFEGSLFSAKRYAARNIPQVEPLNNIRIEIYCDEENFVSEPLCTKRLKQWLLHPLIKDWDVFDFNG